MIQEIKKNRRVTLLSILFLVFFMLCCAWYAYNIEENVKNEALHDMHLLLKQEASAIAGKIEQNYSMLHGISRLITQDQEVSQANLEHYLQVLSGDESYEKINVTDRSDDFFSTNGHQFQIANVPPLPTDSPAPFSDPSSNKMLITFSIPFVDRSATPKTISLTKDVDILEDELLGDFYEGKGNSYVIDASGTIVLRSKQEINGKKFTNLYDKLAESGADTSAALIHNIKEVMNHGHSGVAEITLTGKQYYIAFADVGGAAKQWNLVFIIDREIIGRRSWNIMLQTALLCGAAILSIVLMMVYIMRMRDKTKQGIETLAYVDTLTQLHNLNYFHLKAAELLKKYPLISYAVICVDIKNFKYINKTYGYEVGDCVIQDLAKILGSHFHDQELCARIGNDQFVLLYWMEENPKLLRYYAILEEFIHQQRFGGIKIPLAFTTGVYEVGNRSEKTVAMLDKAILALKSAKNNAVVQCAYYDDTLLNAFIIKQEIENMMHAALAEKEFKLYLQPKYDLHALEFTGAEALVRWNSPERGFMRPDEFIPILEKNGFIIEVDFYILEEICKKMRDWLDNGIPATIVSVNQSRIHMDNPMYLMRLENLIKKYRIPPQHIELELTESMFFDNHEKLIEIMDRMHAIGFLISMDDFGSGYSSLNLLKEIPVDILKIDKVFLDESTNSMRSRIIITQVVEMAHKLGMQVVCEGVETKQQVEFLKEIDCDMIQGYFYAKPMPIGEFDAFRLAPADKD